MKLKNFNYIAIKYKMLYYYDRGVVNMKKYKFLFVLIGLLGIMKVSASTLDFSSGVGVDLIGNQDYLHYYNLYNNYDSDDMITLLGHNVICEVQSSQINSCLANYKSKLEKSLKEAGGDVTGLTVSIMKSKDYENFDEYNGAAGGTLDASTMTAVLGGKYPIWLRYAQNVNNLKTQAVWTSTTVVDEYQFDSNIIPNFDASQYNKLDNNKYISKEIPVDQYNANLVFDWSKSQIKTAKDSTSVKFGVRPVIKIKKTNINREAGSYYKLGDYWYQDLNSKIVLTAPDSSIKITDESVLSVSSKNDSKITGIFNNQNQKVVKSYDINILKNNQKIQPDGKVKIKIPVPTGIDLSQIKVSRVDEDKIIYYDFTIENGFIVFETDHFSDYVISSFDGKSNTQTKNPKTSDNIYLYTAIGLLIIGTISISIKKKVH